MFTKLKCLLDNRVRFGLTVFGISAAVSSVLLIGAVGELGVDSVCTELDGLGLNGLIVSSVGEKDAQRLSDIAGVEKCAPVSASVSRVCSDAAETNAVVWGIDENADDVVTFELVKGRMINTGDIRANSRVCMIDETLAEELFCGKDPIGQTAEAARGSGYEIVGVIKTGGGIMQSMMGGLFPAFMYVPRSASGGDITQVFVKTDGKTPADAISESITRTVGAAANVTDMSGQRSALESLLRIVTMILGVIGGVSLIVSGISIMNVMLISVGERTGEIGIKKSIGASNTDILLDFLLESVIIAVTGTFLGVVSAAFIALCASALLHVRLAVTLASILRAAVGAVAFGLVFGIAPAYKASRMLPVEALRR